MTRRMHLTGLVAFWVAAVSVFLAPCALAAPEVSNTAFTCVPSAGGGFHNAHCNNAQAQESGEWGHLVIPVNTPTQGTLTVLGFFHLESIVAGSEVLLTATGAECVECMVENHEETVEGKTVMDVKGSGGHIRFTGVTTNLPSCTVTGGEFNTEPLKVTTTSATTTLVEPAAGTTIAAVHFNSGCAIGTTTTVTGVARSTSAGATSTFNTGANELKVGKQQAFLVGLVTTDAGVTGSGTMNPIARTNS
jgi:hypothetical protein